MAKISAKLSGLNINFTKTQIVWIGSKKYSNDTRSTQKLILGVKHPSSYWVLIKISAHKIKRYGDNGSPCLQPQPI
jgi:hypothetical protein